MTTVSCSLGFPVVTWDSKFAASHTIGILFKAEKEEELWGLLSHREGFWKIGKIEIPDFIFARQRCAYGLDLTHCSAIDWDKTMEDPVTNILCIQVECRLGKHPPVRIPCEIIREVILPVEPRS